MDLFVFISLTVDGILSVVEKEKVWLIGFYHQSFFLSFCFNIIIIFTHND